MAPLWISASRAQEIVGGSVPGDDASCAICERAHAGLVQARAKLLMVDEERRDNSKVPKVFWWADGMEALEQNWETGDFSTWVDRDVHYRAFGVEFDFQGLKEMVPIEVASRALREFTVAGDPNWMTSSAAFKFCYENDITGLNTTGTQMLDLCRLGLLPGRAMLMQYSSHGTQQWTDEEREWDIPDWFWNQFTHTDASSKDWQRGVFSGRGRSPRGSAYMALTGVHFLREALMAMLPHARTQESSANTHRPAGRPRKEWWDDLWCAIWGQVYRGDLKPSSQADIERAMAAWLIDKGESASESTLKPLARKLFVEMEK